MCTQKFLLTNIFDRFNVGQYIYYTYMPAKVYSFINIYDIPTYLTYSFNKISI